MDITEYLARRARTDRVVVGAVCYEIEAPSSLRLAEEGAPLAGLGDAGAAQAREDARQRVVGRVPVGAVEEAMAAALASRQEAMRARIEASPGRQAAMAEDLAAVCRAAVVALGIPGPDGGLDGATWTAVRLVSDPGDAGPGRVWDGMIPLADRMRVATLALGLEVRGSVLDSFRGTKGYSVGP